MKYTLLVASFFALCLNLHAQSETQTETTTDTQVITAEDKQGDVVQETITTAPVTTQTTTEVTTTTTSDGKPKKAIVTLDLKGEIESIDPENRTFAVGGKTFKLWTTGKVFFKRKQKTLADLKVGDRVAVTYRERADGTLEASRINK
jgi:uncharacterized protein DUF5666